MAAPLPAEVQRLLDATPAPEWFELMVPDVNGAPRGKRVGRREFDTVFAGGLNLPVSTALLNARGENPETIRFGAHDGDPDVVCRYVPGSAAPVPWSDVPMAQALMTMTDSDGAPHWADPRSVLRRVLARFAADGLTPVIALELEFSLLDADSATPAPRLARVPGTTLSADGAHCYNLDELRDYEPFLAAVEAGCRQQGLPVGTAVSEYGPGQFEVNLHHVADAELGCDHALLLKRAVKNIALNHGFVASFMAKPFEAYAGCGTHLHVSVLDDAGRNVFAADDAAPYADTLRHAVGGLAATMAAGMAIFAPNANSYRRFRPGFFAPVNPSWGHNHRSVSLRVPIGARAATRVEHRVAGADCNPYLLTAAVLAGIHHGLEARLEPEPPVAEGADAPEDVTLPLRLGEAVDALERDAVLPAYLGRRYCEVFGATRREENDRFHAQVSNRDYEWYLRTV
ncbi:MAG: glutamine synthetase family protein [Pseudomonadota bacterium]